MSWEASESDSQQANTVNAADAFPSEHSESSDAAMPLSDQVGVVNSAKPAMSKFVVRMPADLLEKLKHVSRYHNRSMNTEINLLLGRYIEQVKGESRPRCGRAFET